MKNSERIPEDEPPFTPPSLDGRDAAWKILHNVCKLRGVDIAMVLSDRRNHDLTHARHHVWYDIWTEIPSMSTTRIGRLFSRDHSTVVTGIKKHRERLEKTG